MTALLLLALPPAPASAQGTGSPDGADGPRRTLDLGVRAGVDWDTDAFVAGGWLLLPVDPGGRIALYPGFDATFLDGLTEWQAGAEVAVFPEATRSFYLGGGAAFRNTLYLDEEDGVLDERETRTGVSVLLGFRTRYGDALVTHLEFRRTFIDDFGPTTLTLGVALSIPPGSGSGS